MNTSAIIHFGSHEAYEVLSKMKAVLLDIRSEYLQDYKRFDVPLYLQISLESLPERAQLLPKDVFYICADSAGVHSKEAAQILLDAGFTKAGNLAGGIVDWERAGLKVVLDPTEELSGACSCMLRPRNYKKV